VPELLFENIWLSRLDGFLQWAAEPIWSSGLEKPLSKLRLLQSVDEMSIPARQPGW
jgi:hypothetical protein